MSLEGTQYFLGNTEIIQSYMGGIPVLFDPFIRPKSLAIEYLIVAGGGGRGGLMPFASQSFQLGGAGGGGGLLSGSATINEGSYEIIIGAGGSNGVYPTTKGSQGNNSSFLSSTSIGGGGGGTATLTLKAGGDGGSGGGAAFFSGSYTPGGTGSFGPPIQGYNGYRTLSADNAGGSGGGASQAALSIPGSGSIWVDGVEYSRGGVGQYRGGFDLMTPGSAAGFQSNVDAENGIVKIRYISTSSLATGGTVQTTGSYVYHIFDTPGTSSFILNFETPLITQSLFAHYDAKNINSYPGSGSVWYDISGNGHNLFTTASVSASFTSSVFPTFNSIEQSLEFNLNNGLISEKISSSIAQTYAITQVAWVKLANISSSVGVMAVQQGSSLNDVVGDGQGYFSGIAYGPTGSNYRWRISSEDWTPADRVPIYSNVNETQQNEWIMMAATLTFGGGLPENNLFTLYRNGNNVLASGSNLNINWFRSTGSLVVGAQYYNSAPSFGVQFDTMFSGSISSVLYYSRALSGNEIQQIYQHGR